MKKIYYILAAALVGMTSCSSDLLTEDTIVENNGKAIVFENMLSNNSTRTSITGSNFKAGSAMEVYGFQKTNGEVDVIFRDQKVSYDGGTKWSYSPVKYWNPQSTYEFYAAYPEGNYTFSDDKNFTINDFTVADAIADQVDLMIAEKNTTTPGNTVTLNFNHILSQVNFYAKISSNLQGVVSGTINNLKVTGLKNMGTFQQNGFETSGTYNVKGNWTSTAGAYPFPAVASTPVAFNYVNAGVMTTDNGNVVRDLLMVPQALSAVLFVDYTLTYADGTKARFTKEVPMESIKFNNVPVTNWEKNTIYNYIMVLDPSHIGKDDYTDIAIDWDGSDNGDAEETPGSTLIGPDENGDYWVDEDGDGTPDYPVVWEDVDGDGKLEGGVDRDGDGHIDNVDGETDINTSTNPEVSDGDPVNNPDGKDVILVDTDGDGKPDTQLEMTETDIIGPANPTQYDVDYDGTLNEDGRPTPNARLTQDANGDFFIEVDTDGDGVYETILPVLWADLDGDGKEEAYIGNVDGENVNSLEEFDPIWQQVTDGNSSNPNGYDGILLDTDGDGTCETQLEREKKIVVGPDPQVSNAIVFSAQVENWETIQEPEVNITK